MRFPVVAISILLPIVLASQLEPERVLSLEEVGYCKACVILQGFFHIYEEKYIKSSFSCLPSYSPSVRNRMTVCTESDCENVVLFVGYRQRYEDSGDCESITASNQNFLKEAEMWTISSSESQEIQNGNDSFTALGKLLPMSKNQREEMLVMISSIEDSRSVESIEKNSNVDSLEDFEEEMKRLYPDMEKMRQFLLEMNYRDNLSEILGKISPYFTGELRDMKHSVEKDLDSNDESESVSFEVTTPKSESQNFSSYLETLAIISNESFGEEETDKLSRSSFENSLEHAEILDLLSNNVGLEKMVSTEHNSDTISLEISEERLEPIRVAEEFRNQILGLKHRKNPMWHFRNLAHYLNQIDQDSEQKPSENENVYENLVDDNSNQQTTSSIAVLTEIAETPTVTDATTIINSSESDATIAIIDEVESLGTTTISENESFVTNNNNVGERTAKIDTRIAINKSFWIIKSAVNIIDWVTGTINSLKTPNDQIDSGVQQRLRSLTAILESSFKILSSSCDDIVQIIGNQDYTLYLTDSLTREIRNALKVIVLSVDAVESSSLDMDSNYLLNFKLASLSVQDKLNVRFLAFIDYLDDRVYQTAVQSDMDSDSMKQYLDKKMQMSILAKRVWSSMKVEDERILDVQNYKELLNQIELLKINVLSTLSKGSGLQKSDFQKSVLSKDRVRNTYPIYEHQYALMTNEIHMPLHLNHRIK